MFDALIIDGYFNPETPDEKPNKNKFLKEIEGMKNEWRCYLEVDPVPSEKSVF